MERLSASRGRIGWSWREGGARARRPMKRHGRDGWKFWRSVSSELAVRLFLVSLLHSMEEGISDWNIMEGAGVSLCQ